MTTDRRLSELSPDKLHARLIELGEDWADKQAAADLLDDTTKTVLSQLTLKAEGKSQAERETKARADAEFGMHLQAVSEARRSANKARVNYDGAKIWIEMMRSIESTERAKMSMR